MGEHSFAPSDKDNAKAMSLTSIKSVIADFGNAAYKSREAGADGVQIHAAHGYLLSQFLSPYYNKRQDEYGGSLQNRSRLLFDIYSEIRKRVGEDYPVLLKLNSNDLIEQGIVEEDFYWISEELDKLNISAIEVSSGIGSNFKTSPFRLVQSDHEEGYNSDAARMVASIIRTPVISVGGYKSPYIIQSMLETSDIAAIAMSRPLIREPHLVKRWEDGDLRSSTCKSCTMCLLNHTLSCSKLEKEPGKNVQAALNE
jgi:2,4-dienoyl-CoA reductase-like NADH-dependent reductase (Old Yellow Enzyme family)